MRAKDLGRLVGSNIIQTKKNIFMCLNNDGVWTRELKKSMFDVRCSCSDEVMILVNIISNKALNLLIWIRAANFTLQVEIRVGAQN